MSLQSDPPKLTIPAPKVDKAPRWFGRTMEELRRDGLPRAWEGEACYIVGGGPSLKSFDFRRLDGLNVIAINRAFEDLPGAGLVTFSDARFWRWHGGGEDSPLYRHSGLKITVQSHKQVKAPCVLNMTGTGRRGLELRPTRLKHGVSTGYAAINIAWHLAPNPIVLLGFDGKAGPNGSDHYHDGHPAGTRIGAFGIMNRYYASIAAPLIFHGVTVINACPGSAIDCFPKAHIDDAVPAIAFT